MAKVKRQIVVGYGGEPSEYLVRIDPKDMPVLVDAKGKNKVRIKTAHCIDYRDYNSKIGVRAKVRDFQFVGGSTIYGKGHDIYSDLPSMKILTISEKDIPQDWKGQHPKYYFNHKMSEACEKAIDRKRKGVK